MQLCELNVGKLLPLASLLENHNANLSSALESKIDLVQRLRAATYSSSIQDQTWKSGIQTKYLLFFFDNFSYQCNSTTREGRHQNKRTVPMMLCRFVFADNEVIFPSRFTQGVNRSFSQVSPSKMTVEALSSTDCQTSAETPNTPVSSSHSSLKLLCFLVKYPFP